MAEVGRAGVWEIERTLKHMLGLGLGLGIEIGLGIGLGLGFLEMRGGHIT